MNPEVTVEMIDSWKKQYGKVFKIDHPHLTLFYRCLTREDYIQLMSNQANAPEDLEITTVKIVALNTLPEDIFITSPGAATVMHEEIMKSSGFVVVESEEL